MLGIEKSDLTAKDVPGKLQRKHRKYLILYLTDGAKQFCVIKFKKNRFQTDNV
jgi:hypothetical protein